MGPDHSDNVLHLWKYEKYKIMVVQHVAPPALTTLFMTKVIVFIPTICTGNDYIHPTMGPDHSDNETHW